MTSTNMFAPRLMLDKKRRMTEEELGRVTNELNLIKKKNAARMMDLAKKAHDTLTEMEEIERQMDTEAKKIHEDYTTEIRDFKLTFAHMYKKDIENSEEHHTDFEKCLKFVKEIKDGAEEMTPGKDE
jgi:seryl-tRNA synthetase